MNGSSTELFSDKVIAQIWKKMLEIYGHKWASHLGSASDSDGNLTDAAQTWRQGLTGVSLDGLKDGFSAVATGSYDWPPSLPEFRKLCLSQEKAGVPTLDEIVSILVTASSRTGSLSARYKHPLAFAVSQEIDMYTLRTAKTVDAKKMLKQVYGKLVCSGWPDWPDHAYKSQCALPLVRNPSKEPGKAALSVIRGLL
jgi:hypothetical protein